MRRVRRGSSFSELLMCVGGMRSIFIASSGLMSRYNICMYMAHFCFYVCCSDCVGVCLCFSLGMLKYVVFFMFV